MASNKTGSTFSYQRLFVASTGVMYTNVFSPVCRYFCIFKLIEIIYQIMMLVYMQILLSNYTENLAFCLTIIQDLMSDPLVPFFIKISTKSVFMKLVVHTVFNAVKHSLFLKNVQ